MRRIENWQIVQIQSLILNTIVAFTSFQFTILCISFVGFRETLNIYFTDELFACHGANCKDNGGRGAGGRKLAPVEPEENYEDYDPYDENEG